MASSCFTNSNFSTNPRIPYPTSHISPRTPLSLTPFHSRKSLFCLPKTETSPKPTSYLPLVTSSLPAQTKISRIITEKIVTLLLGSFVFMGCLRARLAVALPAVQESSKSGSFEEKRDAQNGEIEEDEEMYVKFLEQNPRNVEALKIIVNVKMKKGKTKEAVEYVERLINIKPNEIEWRLLKALCYEMMGQFSMAKRLFKDILKQKPLLLRALHGLAIVMHKNHEGPAVFEMLDTALELACQEKRVNDERNIKILIAQMHLVKGELEEALEKFQVLINENPRDFRPYLCQGIVYSLLDKEKEALEQFEIYRSLVPEEFPQRKFLDDVILSAKTESRQQLEKELQS
ncbi:hypothetical protein ACH5RR_013074 [Cinchona calisaya]|uniref:Chloroplast lumen common family protein n=1 Tax=Cinchona calisaya TaxID=153742 RepID=A0ABD3A2N6_9GENT